MKFDMVLIEKPLDEGLNPEELMTIGKMVNGDMFIPVEYNAEYSSAMGLISFKKAEELEYQYQNDSKLGVEVRKILEDMELETEDHTYELEGAKVLITRGKELEEPEA